MAVDVAYHLASQGGSRWQNNELRFALRALEKNFLDLGTVFVVGFKPPWLTGVTHIPLPDKHKRNKDANLIDKMLAACNASSSELIVRSSDDEMILMPVHVEDLKPYHSGDLRNTKQAFWGGGWKERLKRTMEFLRARGFTTLHFDTHLPKVYNREQFIRIAAECDYQKGHGYTIDTLFLNQVGLVDPPKLSGQKCTMEGSVRDAAAVRQRIAGKQYLGYNDGGLTSALKKVLAEQFPEPSRFEMTKKACGCGITFDDTVKIPTVVAVLGCTRAGTSCTAGLIHSLGISMGEHLKRPGKLNPKGFFEDDPIRHIALANIPSKERSNRLRRWAVGRVPKAGALIGCKYPRLCNYVPEMVAAWPGMKAIAVNRPVGEIVPSVRKAGYFKNHTDAGIESLSRKWMANRDIDLDVYGVPTLHVDCHDVLFDTANVIEKIVGFLGISPTDQQRAAALAFVDTSLHHNHVEVAK